MAVIVIGAGAFALHKRQQSSWSGGDADAGKKLLGNFPFNDVAHISIRHGTNELNLVKKDDLWRVRERGDYPANFSQISEFLLKARDLKIVQTEDIGPSQLARMQLAPGQGSNSAVVVDFEGQADKPIRTLLLGKKHMKKPSAPSQDEGDEGFADGRYVQAGTNSSEVALISDPLDNIDTNPDEWLNKDFLHVEKPKSIEVDSPVATNSWKLTRETETGDWKLANAKAGEELDSSKTSGVTSPFSSASFNDVRPGAHLDESGTNKPTVIKIGTFDNFDYTINIGAKTNDDYLVTMSVTAQLPKERVAGKDEKPADKTRLDKEFKDSQQKLEDKLKQEQGYEQWTYLVPSWTIDPLLKPRGELLEEKKPETKATAGKSEKDTSTNEVPASPTAKN
ncbi:MAG TPA: DUF4340 domain-containing protein [Candidatus Angelobacter sp.]|nr:DUF4340 domain-containing protein [Candidatus Angelobacter sp.]